MYVEGEIRLSSKTSLNDFVASGKTDAHALSVHEEQFLDWYLGPAKTLAALPGTDQGFLLVHTLLAFFEPHGCYLQGGKASVVKTCKGCGTGSCKGCGGSRDDDSPSKRRFVTGLEAFKTHLRSNRAVQPQTIPFGLSNSDFYKLARCSMFHSMSLGTNLLLKPDRAGDEVVEAVSLSSGTVHCVNPFALLIEVERYFERYVHGLRKGAKPRDEELRVNFRKHFNAEHGAAIKHYEALLANGTATPSIASDDAQSLQTALTGSAAPWRAQRESEGDSASPSESSKTEFFTPKI